MKALCYVNHYFGRNSFFRGKSSLSVDASDVELFEQSRVRQEIVNRAVSQIRQLRGGQFDIRICGIEGYALVKLDLSFNNINDKPTHLIYESLCHMSNFVDEYDYFINMEDDIWLPQGTLDAVLEFDKVSQINEILLPNRTQKFADGEKYCVDIAALPGWTQQRKSFGNFELRVALNPHSGILIMSKAKFKYVVSQIDLKSRQATLYNELDSAYAHFHSPMALYRNRSLDNVTVEHLDEWIYSPHKLSIWRRIVVFLRTLRIVDFVPPVIVRISSVLWRSTNPKSE